MTEYNVAFRGQRLWVPQLVSMFGNPLVRLDLEDCTLAGPAVVTFLGAGQLAQLVLPQPESFIEVPTDQVLVGVVAFTECRLQRCRLENVGILGDRRLLDKFLVSSMDLPQ